MKRLSSIIKLTFLTILFNTSLFAQDGEALFKAKCNSCHLVDKASTGPILKGVIQKWTDAGEGDLLTEWVKNSASLITSGKSKMANEIKGFSAMNMPAQTVSKEEVTAILSYVDSYTPPTATPPSATSGSPGEVKTPEVTLATNYKENLTLFYWLVSTVAFLLVAITILLTSVLSLAKSDKFKKRIEQKNENENKSKFDGLNTTIIALIAVIGLIMFGNNSYALTFMQAGEAKVAGENIPWLKVENSDLYILVTINIILLFILLYVRRMFKELLGLLITKQEKVIAPKKLLKLNKILNDTVPIEEEHTILMHHEYDGIRELDNNLPPWWVWGFVATIIFAIIYLLNNHVFQISDSQVTAYEKEMKRSEKEVKAYLSKMSMNVDETSATLMTSSDDLSSGKTLFETNCVTCHNPKGEGNIGPNLTDKNWIYGFDIKEVFKTIKTGTPNGMPEHNSKFNPVQIQQIASYVLSLPSTKGKEPQGEIIEK
jgi:cytochrome c oxidase cbb3-type subunit 3